MFFFTELSYFDLVFYIRTKASRW